jgi:imidazolonepropionase-like amidohydrolase
MSILIQNATLIDGTGAAPVSDGAVLIDGDKVVAAGPRNEVREQAGNGAEVINANGGTIVPGMINCHDHVYRKTLRNPKPGGTYRESAAELMTMPALKLVLLSASNVKKELATGVTTIRDLGAGYGLALTLRDAINSGWVDGPRILAAGMPIAMTGGHGWRMARECDGPDEVRKAVREQLKAGVDCLKFMATGGLASMPVEDPQTVEMTEEELRAGIEEAHKRARLTCAHADATEGVKNAIRAGIDSVEHGAYLDDEAIEMMLARGTTLTPTLSGLWRVAVYFYEAGDKTMGDMITHHAIEPHEESFAKAWKAGILYAAGSDSAGEMVEELELMMKCGVDELQAITSATGSAAKVCGIADRLGTLEAGKLADLLVCAGDPTETIGALRDVRCVVKGGQVVDGTLKLATDTLVTA